MNHMHNTNHLHNIGAYYTVIIPPADEGVRTMWHPSTADGGSLTRGTFATEAEAHAWAKQHLNGTAYSVQYYFNRAP